MGRRALRCILLTLGLFLLFPCRAEPEAGDAILSARAFVDFEEAASGIGGFDARAFARRAIAGELSLGEDWMDRAAEALRDAFISALTTMARSLAPVAAVSVILRVLLGESSRAMAGVNLFCRASCAAVLADAFSRARTAAEGLMRAMARLSEALAPILALAMGLGGAPEAGAGMTPLAAIGAGMIERFLLRAGLPLCAVAAAVAVAGNLSRRLRLDRLFAFLRFCMKGGAALIAASFMGVLTAQGLLLAGRESASSLAARFAVENLVPVIGGELSQAFPSLARGAVAVRGALGLTGLAAILAACGGPILRLAACMLSVKLCAALLDCGADEHMAAMAARFGEIMEMLLAAALASVALAIMLVGAALAVMG